jgi:transglutaminase-like putative cysteine protease
VTRPAWTGAPAGSGGGGSGAPAGNEPGGNPGGNPGGGGPRAALPGRVVGLAAVATAAAAGLAWSSTFALPALAPLVAAVVLPVALVDQATWGTRAAALRPVLGLLFGAAALVGVAVLVLGAGPGELLDGVVHGWQRTLDSTLPARADIALVAFVPVLVLVAAVVGVEWARRGAAALLVVLPGLAVLVVSQAFRAATGPPALVLAVGYGACVAAVLASTRLARAPRVAGRRRRLSPGSLLVVPVLVAAAVVAAGAALLLPGRAAASLQAGHTPTPQVTSVADPLSQIGDRLLDGGRVVFTVRTDAPVDRWPLAVLDAFDGVSWTSTAQLRILGTELDPPRPGAPVTAADADVSGPDLMGPWLPSQPRLRSADGVRGLVDPATGELLVPAGTPTPASYHLRWESLQVDREQLTGALIDPDPTGAVELAEVPAGISDLARTAVGPGVGPSVDAALVLEKWMRDTYTVADGTDIPTGHGYPELLHFLTTSKRGTSEQFATAYAVLARSIGIPTRVVVGFRHDGSGAVRNADALAWPEIAVAGLGWVPLDPTGGARSGAAAGTGLAAATEAAREQLPSSTELALQQPAAPAAPVAAPLTVAPWWLLGAIAVVLLGAVPVAKLVRRAVRRRRAPADAVRGAWRDVRDALTDQGVPVPAGATVRDLADRAPAEPLLELAACVDAVLWSGHAADPAAARTAWRSAGRIRRELVRGSPGRRLRAGYRLSSLRRARQVAQVAPRKG